MPGTFPSVGRGTLKGLVNGAIQGAVSGAVSGGINAASSGGSSGSPQIEIATPTQAGDIILETVPAVADVTSESGGSPIFANIIGATTAISLDSNGKRKENDKYEIDIYSNPAFAGARHMFAKMGNNILELQPSPRFPGTGRNNIIGSTTSGDSFQDKLAKFGDKLKGPLHVTVDKDKFERALAKLTMRYQGARYTPPDSNRFMIELFQEAGRPLSKEELGSIGIELKNFFPIFIMARYMDFKITSLNKFIDLRPVFMLKLSHENQENPSQ